MADLTLARTGRDEFTVAADTRPTYFSYYWSRLPALAQVAIIFFASRVVTTIFLLAFASQQQETSPPARRVSTSPTCGPSCSRSRGSRARR